MRRISRLSQVEVSILQWIVRLGLVYFLVQAVRAEDWLLILGNLVFLGLAIRPWRARS